MDGKQYRIRKFMTIRYSALHKMRCSGQNCAVGDCKKTLRKCADCGGGGGGGGGS